MSVELTKLPEGCPPLTTYYVYLTGGCNLACRHCWLSPKFQKNGDTGGHLDYELFDMAIEEGLPLGLSRVKLTGGEPLLHPDFTRMLDLLKEKNIGLNIETNGVLITSSLARYLKDKSTLDRISVSLDGANSETHDAFRGVKGSFESACQGIRSLVQVGYRPQVIMSLHIGNINEIEALVQLAEGLGAGSVKFNLVNPIGRGERFSERGQTISIQQLIGLGKWIEGDLQKRVPIRLHYSWPMAFYKLWRLVNDGAGSCSIFNLLGILPTGHLAMCGIGTHIPELCYGRLGEDRIVDIWTSHHVLTDLRQSLPATLTGVCADCLFQNRCLGHCAAENYYIGKSLTAPFWFCQMAKDVEIFPVSRLRIQE